MGPQSIPADRALLVADREILSSFIKSYILNTIYLIVRISSTFLFARQQRNERGPPYKGHILVEGQSNRQTKRQKPYERKRFWQLGEREAKRREQTNTIGNANPGKPSSYALIV